MLDSYKLGTCEDSFAIGVSLLDSYIGTGGYSGLHDWMEIGLPFGDGGMSLFTFISKWGGGKGFMFRILTVVWYRSVW
jgi:hypothetical protein